MSEFDKRFPLCWPDGYPKSRWKENSRFGGTESQNRDFMLDELRKLGASKIIVSTNRELRLDGLPRANQSRTYDEGVAVYFCYNNESMVFACDCYGKTGCNYKAIGKTIEAMRGIDRWGVSDMMRRMFSGFAQLPYYPDVITLGMSWRDILGFDSAELLNEEKIRSKHRKLAKDRHPDKPGGSNEQMSELNSARDMALKEVS